MSTGPLLAFFLLFGLAGLGVFLADRMFRDRGQAYLRSYALHLAFWNGHALVLVMQFILGSVFLPRVSWAPLAFVTGPVILLLAAVSMNFLIVFAARAAGARPSRWLMGASIALWSALALFFVLKAGQGTLAAGGTFTPVYSIAFLALKTATVLGSMGLPVRPCAQKRDSGRRPGPAPCRRRVCRRIPGFPADASPGLSRSTFSPAPITPSP